MSKYVPHNRVYWSLRGRWVPRTDCIVGALGSNKDSVVISFYLFHQSDVALFFQMPVELFVLSANLLKNEL
jgi:hypothetical protein